MKTGLPNPTAAERRRMEIIKFEIGCIACRIDGNHGVWADAHHLLDCGRRISHSHTIPLCPGPDGHHTGVNSIHKRKKWFAGRYGTDQELLDQTNNLVARFEENTI